LTGNIFSKDFYEYDGLKIRKNVTKTLDDLRLMKFNINFDEVYSPNFFSFT